MITDRYDRGLVGILGTGPVRWMIGTESGFGRRRTFVAEKKKI